MALYTVFVDKGRRPGDLGPVMDSLTAAAHVQPEVVSRRIRRTQTGPVATHAISTTTSVYAADDQVAFSGRRMTALHGFVVDHAATSRGLTAADIDASLGSTIDWSVVDEWMGDYSVCHVHEDGAITAWSDLHRVQSVFYLDTPTLFAVSTRPSQLRLLAGGGSLDVDTAAAICATGYSYGSTTVHRGVRAVPQGMAVRWDGRRASLIRRHGVVGAPMPGGIDVDDPAVGDELDRGIEGALEVIRLTMRGEDELNVALTGGKDSRAVLAMCLAHGLGPQIRAFTRGEPDHPDVVSAGLLAERAGVRHRVLPPPAANLDPTATSPAEFVGRIARYTFLTDGLSGAQSAFAGRLRTGTEFSITGLMGEVLRGFGKKAAPTTRPTAAEVVGFNSPFDPLGLLTPQARQRLSDGLDGRFDELAAAGHDVADLPDLYYYENRIPNWVGHARQLTTFLGTSVAPLGAVPLARVALRASTHQRRMDLLPYLIIGRTAPQLLDVPFSQQVWDPRLPGAPALAPLRMPTRPDRVVRANLTWQLALNNRPIRKALTGVVRDVPRDSDLWHAIDRTTTLEKLWGPKFSPQEGASMLGVIAMVMHASGQVEHTKVVSPGSALPLEPYRYDAPRPVRRRTLATRLSDSVDVVSGRSRRPEWTDV